MTKKAIVAGAGVMGASLAQVYAEAGYDVVLYDLAEKFLDRGKHLIALNQETLVKAGLITADDSAALVQRISFSCDDACFAAADVDIILESIVEKLEIKQGFWEKVSRLANAHCLLATNTSGLHISDIAAKMDHKDRFMGQHWLNPPHLLPLAELIIGADTAAETVTRMKDLVRGLGKNPVCVKDINGFIINRLQFAILREAMHIVDSGAATVEDIDDVMKYGMGLRLAALGPFRIADLGGLDTFDHISQYLFADLDNSKEGNSYLHSLVEDGKLGVKSGQGYYDYSGDKADEAIKERDELFIKLAKCLYK
ncbi:3-hydroxyacyl-CoA dehydrogenase family protein [Megasphaera hominis]|jgi:3-hydroxybutyryl-CoA dehydrogenase|uniref:3-hydroxyacyl-CoA dehydrogenase family protein n=1 Tax=Megasphaera hominis TaxID=159836 RepID=A0ABR6VJ48_9FIRM|nr:3-hydroxyacyl-CoA dehydrogenase family protein [Megasphaera hominis]MBC3537178.1 3-hydroxyacyl-CoA dehydrogenase family protein [Megasphaera hominis]